MIENKEKSEDGKNMTASRPAYGSSNAGDLLNQIAAPDRKEEREREKKKKKKTVRRPISSLSFVFLMRTTLVIDAFKRKHRAFFEVLSYVWLIFILLVYAGGLTMIIAINYSKTNFPKIVEHYLKRNKIEAETLKVEDDTLSRIKLTNVQDKDKSYHIRNIYLHSTFGDFLKKKVHRVEFDYLTIKITDTGTRINLSSLFPLLLNLDTQQDISIDAVVIRKALLKIEGKDYEVPINFSMNAQFDQQRKIEIPLSIRDKNSNLTALLIITKSGNNLIWNVKNLIGHTDLFSKQSENVSGQITLKTNEFTPTELNVNTTFSLGANSKNVILNLNGKKKGFSGTARFIEEVSTDKNKQKILDTTLTFESINIDSLSSVNSLSPITLNIQKLIQPSVEIDNLETTLHGNLSCKKLSCAYDITDSSDIKLQKLVYKDSAHTYTSTKPIQFKINPKEKAIQISKDFTSVKISGDNLNYEGEKTPLQTSLQLSADSFSLETTDLNPERTASFSAQNLNFKNTSQEIKNASIFIKNIYTPDEQFSLNSDYVQLFNNDVIKKPFALNISSTNGQTQAVTTFANDSIQAKFNGIINLDSGHFKGTIFIPSIDLEKTSNLDQLSNLFPKNVDNLKGTISLYGNIDWKNDTQISGPLYLSLKDVSFSKGETKVKNLNSVLTLQSLKPFISQSAQYIAIDEIAGDISMQNIRGSVKFENQMLRLFSLKGSFANVPLTADHVSIPYKSESAFIYFRNGSVNWQNINSYLKIKDLSLNGTGSIYLPIELTPENIKVKNGEVKFSNTLLKYTGKDSKIKNTLFKSDNEYSIRNGTVNLNSAQNKLLDAYINLEGREKNETEHQFYKTDMTFKFSDLFKPEEIQPIPLNIQKIQYQLSKQ